MQVWTKSVGKKKPIQIYVLFVPCLCLFYIHTTCLNLKIQIKITGPQWCESRSQNHAKANRKSNGIGSTGYLPRLPKLPVIMLIISFIILFKIWVMLSMGPIFKTLVESKQCRWERRYNIDYSDNNSLLFGSSKTLVESLYMHTFSKLIQCEEYLHFSTNYLR